MKPPLFTGCGAHCSPDFPLRTRRSDGTALFGANIGGNGEWRVASGDVRVASDEFAHVLAEVNVIQPKVICSNEFN